MKKIVFTGGGSAGHVLPNIAIIQELLKRGTYDVYYFGSSGIEKELVSALKIPYYEMACPKLYRGTDFYKNMQNLKIPFDFSKAEKLAMRGLKTIKPDLVFSKGGYVALPVVSAAKKLKIPCLTHESDFTIGLANKLMANKCEHVLTSFPETAEKVKNGKYTGAPVRKNLFNVSKIEARERLGIHTHKKVLLVFGGGSGSAAINLCIRTNAPKLCEKYFILHICGKNNGFGNRMDGYKQMEFISDMGSAYALADLVIARSGAGTAFEVLALKKRAIFIPLEAASRGDQLQNAKYFQSKGLCKILRQKNLGDLPKAIDETLRDDKLKENLERTQTENGLENVLFEIDKICGA